jgi:hypothetical protein
MQDDGGSVLTNAVSREIKEALERVVQHLETTHAISARKVSEIYFSKYASSLTTLFSSLVHMGLLYL